MLQWAETDLSWQRGRWIFQFPGGLSEKGQQVARTLADLLNGHTRYSLPWVFVCDLLLEHRLGLPSLADDSITAHEKRIALWQFAYSVRIREGDGKRPSLPRYLLRQRLRQRIGETYSDRELPSEASVLNAINIQTLHGSKGLEYDAVHICYIDKGSYGAAKNEWMPEDDVTDIVPPDVLNSSASEYDFEQAIERNNLLYVAVSRARQRLLMYEDGEWANRNRPEQLRNNPTVYRAFEFRDASSGSPAVLQSSSDVIQRTGSFSYEEFETYVRCPLQHRYRFVLGLKREQEPDNAYRARRAIMTTLRGAAGNHKADSDRLFDEAWKENRLPSAAEDPALWNDALAVCRRGVAKVRNIAGRVVEVTTNIAGVAIQFPWMIEYSTSTDTRYELIRFSASGMSNVVTLTRPMLAGLPNGSPQVITISNLLSSAQKESRTTGNLTRTNAYLAARDYSAGSCSPTPGRQCRRCSYMTMCPANPGTGGNTSA
jgi:hypothetical protein